uniref:Ig-like domain-containing protein n=1 Tax=Pygocentrus nattereri TaxID=42514 RepID=A0AAR2IJV2_PYGNA
VLVHAFEDETVTLSCKYEYGASVNNLQWYRQYPGSRPEHLLMIIPTSKNENNAIAPFPRMDAKEYNKTMNLTISPAAVSDSALYYCAMEPTVTGNPATLFKNSLQDALHFVCVCVCVCQCFLLNLIICTHV